MLTFRKFLQGIKKTPVVKSYFSKVAGFYRSSHWRCSVEKDVLRKLFAKFTGKQLWFAKFSRTLFYRTPLDDQFWLFPATLLKWDIANSLETLTLEVPVRYIISFLATSTFSVCFHWFALFTSRSSHQNRGILKNFVNSIGKHL